MEAFLPYGMWGVSKLEFKNTSITVGFNTERLIHNLKNRSVIYFQYDQSFQHAQYIEVNRS